jgi:DNA invertase Pin-like site-specific DNA recombinase
MGRLTLNVLLSFAQFEREVTSERIRDKIGASKRNGLAEFPTLRSRDFSLWSREFQNLSRELRRTALD